MKDIREKMAKSTAEAMGRRTEKILKDSTTEEEYAAIQEYVKDNGPIKVPIVPVDW